MVACALAAVTPDVFAASENGKGGADRSPFSYEDYGRVLQKYVDKNGLVAYTQLKANQDDLKSYLKRVADLDRAEYNKWGDNDRIAFWVNAYNGITLKAIVDHYPIKSSWWTSRFYPKNSIRQIDGVWDALKWDVMGSRMTLDGIEHETLRKHFNEPRIHMALVCAAMSCPELRNEPYVGFRFDKQLKDQTRQFLEKPKNFRIDRRSKRVYLSSIFKWFGEDFVKTYGPKSGFEHLDENERAVLNFISRHLSKANREYLTGAKVKVSYLDYDWSLNEK